MLKPALLLLVVSWSISGIIAENAITFDPPELGHEDTEVKLTARYDLGGQPSEGIYWEKPEETNAIIGQLLSAQGTTEFEVFQDWVDVVSDYDDVDNLDTTHSLKISGNWCSLLGQYQAVLGTDPLTEITETLTGAEVVTVEVDGEQVTGDAETSQLTGKVKCTAHWHTSGVELFLREGDQSYEEASYDSNSEPAPCTTKAVIELDYDFNGAKDEAKKFTYKIKFSGPAEEVEFTLKFKGDDGNQDNGDDTTPGSMHPTEGSKEDGGNGCSSILPGSPVMALFVFITGILVEIFQAF